MKRRAAITAAALCIGIISFSTTLSFRTDNAEKVNHFTFIGEKGLDAVLIEPSWVPENGLLTLPNTLIPKDPQITNTSEANLDELVAVRMEFRYSQTCPDVTKRGCILSAEDMTAINRVYEIDYNSDTTGEWIRFEEESKSDPVQHFYYSDVLRRNYPLQGETTVPLFNRLKISSEIGNEQFQPIQNIGGFDIVLTGLALQYIPNETEFGLGNADDAYRAGLFLFEQ